MKFKIYFRRLVLLEMNSNFEKILKAVEQKFALIQCK